MIAPGRGMARKAGNPVAVTILVPTFNRADYLFECLTSLTGQSRPAAEIIVIDDGSTDNTADIVGRFPAVRYAHQENSGKAAALNLGLSLAQGNSIWIFDDDDIAALDALERLSDALGRNPAAGFAFGGFDRFAVDRGRRRQLPPPEPRAVELDDLFWQQIMRCTIFQGAMLVRKSCYDAVGPFDADLTRAQDYDMLLRLARSYRAVRVDDVMFHQRRHSGARGTAIMRAQSGSAPLSQGIFDAKVVANARAASTLSDFLPEGERARPLTSGLEAHALLRRSAAMGRRGLWNEAGEDLTAALAIARAVSLRRLPADVLTAFAQCFSADSDSQFRLDNPVLAMLRTDAGRRFRRPMMASLGWQPLLNGLKSFAAGKPAEGFQRIKIYFKITRGADLPMHLARFVSWTRGHIVRSRA